MCHDTKEWRKIWRKNELWFQKWHKEFGELSPENSKTLKIRTLIDKESKEYNVLAKKIIDKLCVMTHFKGKLTHEGKMI